MDTEKTTIPKGIKVGLTIAFAGAAIGFMSRGQISTTAEIGNAIGALLLIGGAWTFGNSYTDRILENTIKNFVNIPNTDQLNDHQTRQVKRMIAKYQSLGLSGTISDENWDRIHRFIASGWQGEEAIEANPEANMLPSPGSKEIA